MVFTFLRHTESVHKTSNIEPEQDKGLNENGRAQAQKLKAMLGSTFFQAAISSPLQRAIETATIVYPPPKKIETDERLSEIRKPSALINLSEEDELFKTIKQDLLTHGHKKDWKHSDEESYYEFHQRITSFLDTVAVKPTLVVTHSGVIRMIIAIIKNLKADPETVIRSFLDSRHTTQIEYGTAVKIEMAAKKQKVLEIVNLL